MYAMKLNTFNIVIAAIISLALLQNCTSTDKISTEGPGSSKADADESKDFDEALDLTAHLSKISGLRVVGEGASAQITVRGGQNSFQLSSTPLFVLNDTPQAGGYAAFYGLVDVGSIRSIRVLKGADAALYGSRGNNGVIMIRTR